ncbi:MAG: fibronectin type III domain-containing protein [Clostridiales bacterium]|nr:fibronectin type III domain-containing protein [Candidatus Crickella equi]
MKQNWFRKCLVLLLTLTMVLGTFSASFADAAWPANSKATYLAIGDSIGAGFLANEDVNGIDELSKLYTEEPEFDIYGIMYENEYGPKFCRASYVQKVFNYMNADCDSFNMTYPGLRAEQVCNILGVMDADKEYQAFDSNKRTAYRKLIEKKIQQADVITVQLGFNDITKQLYDNEETILKAIETTAKSIDGLTDIPDKIQDIKDTKGIIAKSLKLITTVVKVNAYAAEASVAPITLDTLLTNGANNAVTATSKIVDRIRELNPDAVVVIVNLFNPLATIGDTMIQWELIDSNLGAKALNDVATVLAQPYVDTVNKGYAAIGAQYGYEIADITNIAPHKAKVFHIDMTAQARIADIIEKSINREWTLRESAKEGGVSGWQSPSTPKDRCQCEEPVVATRTITAATYLTTGEVQHYCTACGNNLSKEYIERVQLQPVKNITIKAGSKKATVKHKTVAGATGYQIYYKQSGKSGKKIKTTALTKTIKKLKSGKKYIFKVRAYVTGNGKTYYSQWSKNYYKKIK